MKTYSILGRCNIAPPPGDWRDQLTRMLGAKPRRIGTWAELGLYGALSCMADSGEQILPQQAQIWLCSRRGTYAATDIVLAQLREDLPMPLAFLQTQPSQMLAILAAKLDWKGHACFLAGAEPEAMLRLAAAQSAKDGILLGCLDELEGGESRWLRLKPGVAVGMRFEPLAGGALFSSNISHLRMSDKGLEANT